MRKSSGCRHSDFDVLSTSVRVMISNDPSARTSTISPRCLPWTSALFGTLNWTRSPRAAPALGGVSFGTGSRWVSGSTKVRPKSKSTLRLPTSATMTAVPRRPLRAIFSEDPLTRTRSPGLTLVTLTGLTLTVPPPWSRSTTNIARPAERTVPSHPLRSVRLRRPPRRTRSPRRTAACSRACVSQLDIDSKTASIVASSASPSPAKVERSAVLSMPRNRFMSSLRTLVSSAVSAAMLERRFLRRPGSTCWSSCGKLARTCCA
mmetsp:Transcript_9269/g.38011  ORF Transcript_9269/g.38011 Transcript_9269/m.38011 type:complete len:262 (+) Transcript_9269:4511-5296(+)